MDIHEDSKGSKQHGKEILFRDYLDHHKWTIDRIMDDKKHFW